MGGLDTLLHEVSKERLGNYSSAPCLSALEFQVTAVHTHEDLHCETGSDVNATIASESWYCMIGLYLIHRAITFGAEFDLGILIFAAQTRHV
jgi:hypothetical protein